VTNLPGPVEESEADQERKEEGSLGFTALLVLNFKVLKDVSNIISKGLSGCITGSNFFFF